MRPAMMHAKDRTLRAGRIRELSTSAMIALAVALVVIIVGPGAMLLDRMSSSSASPDISVPTPTVVSNAIAAPAETATDAAAIPQHAGAQTQHDASTNGTFAAAIPAESLTAQSVYAYRVSDGVELYGYGEDERLPVGSTTKIATALVVMDHAALDEEVTIDPSDLVDITLYSNMSLVAGDTLTVEQLLQGLLVASGTDAAQALARYVGAELSGSADPETARAAFYDAMNAYAANLGLANTHFANAGGEDDPGNYSTAKEIALLGGELMMTPELAQMVAMPSYSFVSPGLGTTYEGANTNQLLGIDGITGVKTGSTGEAGGCVVLAKDGAEAGDLVVVAILGSDLTYNELNQIVTDTRWDDAKAIFAGIDGTR